MEESRGDVPRHGAVPNHFGELFRGEGRVAPFAAKVFVLQGGEERGGGESQGCVSLHEEADLRAGEEGGREGGRERKKKHRIKSRANKQKPGNKTNNKNKNDVIVGKEGEHETLDDRM